MLLIFKENSRRILCIYLVYILDRRQGRNSPKLVDGKLSRWSLTLMTFMFTVVERISGEDNVVADMLSRWKIASYPQTVRAANFSPGQYIKKNLFGLIDISEIKKIQSK